MQVVDGTILVALGQRRCTVIEILRETPSFRAGRKGGGPCGATAEPSGGVEAPAFRPGRTSTDFYCAITGDNPCNVRVRSCSAPRWVAFVGRSSPDLHGYFHW